MSNETTVPGGREKNPVFLLLIQAALGSLGIFLLLGATFDAPVWQLGVRRLLVLFLVGSAYGVIVLGVLIAEWLGRRTTFLQLLLAVAAAAVPAFVAFLVLEPQMTYMPLFAGLAIVLVLTLATFATQRGQLVKLGALAIMVAAGASLQAMTSQRSSTAGERAVKALVGTSLYNLDMTSFVGPVPRTRWSQGGLTLFGDRYLLTTGDGKLFAFRRDDGQRLDIQQLPYRVPINIEAFQSATQGLVAAESFRVADALARNTPSGIDLLVTHHFWKEEDNCWVMRVSALRGTYEQLTTGPEAPLRWSTVYETSPCVPLAQGEGEPIKFTGVENGGRLALLDEDHLLITVGDHEMDGWATSVMAAQDAQGAYGKTILIDLRDGSHEIYSLGHRNPQGLFISPSGNIWSTEHGPAGGDELNIVTRGSNYGWPLATYGVEYGTTHWPLTDKPGSHEGYALPFYSWIPSIGASVVLEVAGPKFENWRGDLLVGSLTGQTLWRLRLRENRVVLAEQIPMGVRIRDLLEGHDGELVMWGDGPSNRQIRFIEPGQGPATGEFMYRVCSGCHVPPPGMTTAVGPSLEGIVGRNVASQRGFTYSQAMQAAGGEWTRERLEAFLINPQSVVPGTTMFFAGIEDEESRKALLDYLEDPDSRLDIAPLAPL